jgi:hypothetical protein
MTTQELAHEHPEFAEVAADRGGKLASVLPTSIDQSFGITMALSSVDAASMGVAYTSPNDNDPVGNNNNLFVFQTQGPNIPFTQTPVASSNVPVGSTPVFPNAGQNFGANPYVVAYSVGPAVTTTVGGKTTTTYSNVAATIYTPQGTGAPLGPPNNQPVGVASTITISSATTQYVIYKWGFPPGVNPAIPTGVGAWIGMWTDHINPYTTPPMAFAPISGKTPSGSTAITGLNLSGSSPYTAALFTSGYTSNAANLPTGNIACYIYFTTGNAL